MSDGEDPAVENRWEVGVNLGGDSKGGGEIIDDGVVYRVTSEHGHTLYRYMITVRPV